MLPSTTMLIASGILQKYPLYACLVSTSSKYSTTFFLIFPILSLWLQFCKIDFRERTEQDIDKSRTEGYTNNRKGAAGRRSAPQVVTRSNRNCWDRLGGYFLFLACRNKPQIPMMTKQSCNTSDVLMGTPSFHRRGQEVPSGMERLTVHRYWQR